MSLEGKGREGEAVFKNRTNGKRKAFPGLGKVGGLTGTSAVGRLGPENSGGSGSTSEGNGAHVGKPDLTRGEEAWQTLVCPHAAHQQTALEAWIVEYIHGDNAPRTRHPSLSAKYHLRLESFMRLSEKPQQ